MLQIVAVGMLDPENTGRDVFFVQQAEDEVMQYEVFKDGRIVPLWPSPEPMDMVASSIEKFNHGYRVDHPVPIQRVEDLPRFIARFQILDEVTCRYAPVG